MKNGGVSSLDNNTSSSSFSYSSTHTTSVQNVRSSALSSISVLVDQHLPALLAFIKTNGFCAVADIIVNGGLKKCCVIVYLIFVRYKR
jgi:hypothetical protein